MEKAVWVLSLSFSESRAEKCLWKLLICVTDVGVWVWLIMTVNQYYTQQIPSDGKKKRSGVRLNVWVFICERLISPVRIFSLWEWWPPPPPPIHNADFTACLYILLGLNDGVPWQTASLKRKLVLYLKEFLVIFVENLWTFWQKITCSHVCNYMLAYPESSTRLWREAWRVGWDFFSFWILSKSSLLLTVSPT